MQAEWPFRVTQFGWVGIAGQYPILLATVRFNSVVELRAEAKPPAGQRTGWSLEVTGYKAKDRAEEIAGAYLQEHGTEFIALLLAAYQDERINLPPFDLGPEQPRELFANGG
jgi:hypothetical protein